MATQMTETQLARKLTEMLFGPPPKPRPCKRYRVSDYDRGTNRYFRTREEAIAHAAAQAKRTGEEVEILYRSSHGRGRCPNVWEGQAEYVQIDGTIKSYWAGEVRAHYRADGTRVGKES